MPQLREVIFLIFNSLAIIVEITIRKIKYVEFETTYNILFC